MSNEVKKYDQRSDCYEVTLRCKAFSDEGVRKNKLLVNPVTEEILVWDSVARHYTTCYSVLTMATKNKALALVA